MTLDNEVLKNTCYYTKYYAGQFFSEAGMKVVIADVRQDHTDKAAEHFKGKTRRCTLSSWM